MSAYKTRNIGKKQGEIVKQGKSARLPFRYGREKPKGNCKAAATIKKIINKNASRKTGAKSSAKCNAARKKSQTKEN